MVSDNTRGALLMAGSMTAFTLNDTLMKTLAGEVPFFQAVFLRGVATLVLMVAIAPLFGGLRLRLSRRDWRLVVLRSLAEVASAYFFITALYNMPLANVSAILQALPLTVTLAGALIFGEAVGWRRLGAILVGFAGVLLIVRPGTEGFTIYSVYALLAVAFVTVRDLTARRMSREVPSFTVAISAAVAVTVFMGAGSVFVDWAPMGVGALLAGFGASVFVIAGYLCSVAAMRVGEIGAVAPFRYTSLLVALVLGFLVFGDWPATPTLIGGALVVATGLFTLYRERARAAAPSAVSRPAPLRIR
ncbi:DMT family transporter [Mesobaculum littorinae]|uniref:DMT family transporter n=1 Tax=Mesobaculum littorinae TaxID=2486419 RepID=A0A438ACX8_9RHOB|nr:DMT family transporter [Mesobaculum littorinae]RVV96540.1 DMT family transporter [Mesobaculum littorinae]